MRKQRSLRLRDWWTICQFLLGRYVWWATDKINDFDVVADNLAKYSFCWRPGFQGSKNNLFIHYDGLFLVESSASWELSTPLVLSHALHITQLKLKNIRLARLIWLNNEQCSAPLVTLPCTITIRCRKRRRFSPFGENKMVCFPPGTVTLRSTNKFWEAWDIVRIDRKSWPAIMYPFDEHFHFFPGRSVGWLTCMWGYYSRWWEIETSRQQHEITGKLRRRVVWIIRGEDRAESKVDEQD